MVYAMPGMETAERGPEQAGQSFGISSNYSGAGFSDMKFGYRGVPQGDFDAWVQSGQDRRRRQARPRQLPVLEKPSIKEPVRRWGAVDGRSVHRILNRCVAEGAVCRTR
jgi:cytochrome o ubiquinol oxidase subunit 2